MKHVLLVDSMVGERELWTACPNSGYDILALCGCDGRSRYVDSNRGLGGSKQG